MSSDHDCRLPLAWLPVVLLGVVAGAPATAEEAHFHHVHLNVTDVEETTTFYEKVFGAVEIRYGGEEPALFTERSFLLFDEVDETPPTNQASAIWHIGWGGVNGPAEYEYWKSQGVEFQNPATPLGDDYWMYLYGPDAELIEIFTGERNHRFNHVHLLATDTNVTTDWYREHLGLEPRRPSVEPSTRGDVVMWSNSIRVDNVSIVVFGIPDPESPPWYVPPEAKAGAFAPSDGRSIDHIAFSFTDIEPVFERMKAAGVEIVSPPAPREELGGDSSFFVLAPDGVLVEVVQAKPIPDAAWQ